MRKKKKQRGKVWTFAISKNTKVTVLKSKSTAAGSGKECDCVWHGTRRDRLLPWHILVWGVCICNFHFYSIFIFYSIVKLDIFYRKSSSVEFLGRRQHLDHFTQLSQTLSQRSQLQVEMYEEMMIIFLLYFFKWFHLNPQVGVAGLRMPVQHWVQRHVHSTPMPR